MTVWLIYFVLSIVGHDATVMARSTEIYRSEAECEAVLPARLSFAADAMLRNGLTGRVSGWCLSIKVSELPTT